MTPQQIKNSICALFDVQQDGDTLVVSTPLNTSGEDKVHIYITPTENNLWRIDDNGETAFAAAMAGVNTRTEQFKTAVEASIYGSSPLLTWDDDDEFFSIVTNFHDIGVNCLALAHAASRLYLSTTTPKKIKEKSDFKERIVGIINSIAEETKLDIEIDTPVTNDLLIADCRLDTPVPTYVVVATSAIRLGDAELMHSRLQLAQEPGYVLAVVEDVKSVGKSHYTRATYLTDKTVQWDSLMFNALIKDRATHKTPSLPQ